MSPYNLSACPHRACPPLVLVCTLPSRVPSAVGFTICRLHAIRGNRFARTSIRRIPLRSLTVPPSSLSPCHSDIALPTVSSPSQKPSPLDAPSPSTAFARIRPRTSPPRPAFSPTTALPCRGHRTPPSHPLLSFYNDAGEPRPIARGPRHPIHEVLPSTSPTFARPQQRVYAIA
ncbi:hypothetical protein B0H14DRAFT_1428852 [Mycena olivaceomarginata]|nr:hypothetical protein B0H14DRAFT_1428852 [Mycena olivaceomarginata]